MAATKKATKKVAAKKVAKKAAAAPPAGGRGDPNTAYRKRLNRRTEENLTDRMRYRRDVFVTEYLRDFNGAQAWLRMKAICEPEDDTSRYTAAQCAEHAYQLRQEPYTAKRIADGIDALNAATMLTQQRVMAMAIREAELQGAGAKHAARVSAIKLLSDKLDKMAELAERAEAAAKQARQGTGLNASGVMVVPPVAATVDDWEARAAAAQARLKQEVRQ